MAEGPVPIPDSVELRTDSSEELRVPTVPVDVVSSGVETAGSIREVSNREEPTGTESEYDPPKNEFSPLE